MIACDHCGVELVPHSGRGRPRVRCEACAANKSALAKAWREEHPDARAAYNLARRIEPEAKVCVECGRAFAPRRRDALLCREQCRNARKARRRWGAGVDRDALAWVHPALATHTHITKSAAHEASHAVTALLLLGPTAVDVVTIREGRGHSGLTLIDCEPMATATREQVESFVIVVLAGDIGGWLAEPVSGYLEETGDEIAAKAAIASLARIPAGSRAQLLAAEAVPSNPEGGDEPTAMRHVMALADSELLEASLHLAYLRARASRVVQRHLSAIRAVASVLLEQTTIVGAEVGAIVASYECVCHVREDEHRGTDPPSRDASALNAAHTDR